MESRRVVSTLAAAPADNASADVAQTVATAAMRHGLGLSLDVDRGRSFSLSERDALVQIIGEAVGNAARRMAEPIESTSNWLPDDWYVSLTTAPALIQRSIERQDLSVSSACESGLKPSGPASTFGLFRARER